MSNTAQALDVQALIAEATAEIDKLLKAEVEKLHKSEEKSKKEESKEESKKEDSKLEKDDESSSHYENQSPEMDAPAEPAPEMDQSPEAPQEGAGLADMVKELDDSMLQELHEAIMQEMQMRQPQEEAPPEQAPEMDQSAPAPEAPPEMSMGKSEKEESEELKKTQKDLAEAQQQISKLSKAFEEMTELVQKAARRPVTKAVTSVDIVPRGDELKKSESPQIDDRELEARLRGVAGDMKKLATLTKSEQNAVSEYFVGGKKRNETVIKIALK